jgi:hypothetical protein
VSVSRVFLHPGLGVWMAVVGLGAADSAPEPLWGWRKLHCSFTFLIILGSRNVLTGRCIHHRGVLSYRSGYYNEWIYGGREWGVGGGGMKKREGTPTLYPIANTTQPQPPPDDGLTPDVTTSCLFRHCLFI